MIQRSEPRGRHELRPVVVVLMIALVVLVAAALAGAALSHEPDIVLPGSPWVDIAQDVLAA